MRKFFRRRELFSERARIGAEGFGVAWVIQSWLHSWGEPGTWLWWLNFALTAIVVLGMFTLLFTKPKREPTFEEQLQAHLKRNHYVLTTREMAGRFFPSFGGMPIVESPFVPKGQFFAVNPQSLRDMIARMDPEVFRETNRERLFLGDLGDPERCPVTWTSSEGRCANNDAGDGLHHCSRSAEHSKVKDVCKCACGAATTVPWEQIAKDRMNPTTGLPWCWCARKNCPGCPK